MFQSSEQKCLPFKSLSSFINLQLAQTILAHFLYSQKSIAKLDIFSLIDRTETPLAYLAHNTVTLLEQKIGGKKPSGGADCWPCDRI